MFSFFTSTTATTLDPQDDPSLILEDQDNELLVVPGQVCLLKGGKKATTAGGGGGGGGDSALNTFYPSAFVVVRRDMISKTGAGGKKKAAAQDGQYILRILSKDNTMIDAFGVNSGSATGADFATIGVVVSGIRMKNTGVQWNHKDKTDGGNQFPFVQWEEDFSVHSKDGCLVSSHSPDADSKKKVPIIVRFAFGSKREGMGVQGVISSCTFAMFGGKDGQKNLDRVILKHSEAMAEIAAAKAQGQQLKQVEEEEEEEDDEEAEEYDMVDDAAILGGYISNNMDENWDDNQEEEDDMPLRSRQSRSMATPSAGRNLRCFAQQASYGKAVVVAEGAKNGGCTIRATSYMDGSAGSLSVDILRADLFSSNQVANDGGDVFIDDILCNQAIDTQKVLLHNSADTNAVYELDLEAGGKQTAAYDPGMGYQINSIKHHFDAATGKEDPNLVSCLGNKTAYMVDKRMKGSAGTDRGCAVVESATNHLTDYQFTLNGQSHFTCQATSPQGYLAVGDAKGQIRLFTGPPGAEREGGGRHPKASKTLLPGNPQAGPVLHLEISNDSRYVLATFADHLLVMSTEGKEKNPAGRGFLTVDGFQKSLNNKKQGLAFNSQPLQLSLSRDQVATIRASTRQGGDAHLAFANAVFDNHAADSDMQATCIVATVGGSGFIAQWHMADVDFGLKTKTAVSAVVVQVSDQSRVQQVAAIAGNYAVHTAGGGGGGGGDVDALDGAFKDLLCLTNDTLECASVNVGSTKSGRLQAGKKKF